MAYFLLFLSLLFTSCTSGTGYQRSYMISHTDEAEEETVDNDIDDEQLE